MTPARLSLSLPLPRNQTGFTLVELIVVMVITGILAGMVALFIRAPIQSYVDTVARAELSDVADTALRRISRDLRLALPNSIRVNGNFVELLLTKTGGRYLAEEDELGLTGILSFDAANPSPNPLVFSVVGTMPSGRQQILPNDFIVVYNLGQDFEPANAYDCTVPCNRATVASVSGNSITMLSNPFIAQVPPLPSPSSRFQVVTTPVTYHCNSVASGGDGRLMRYSGYAIQKNQPVDAGSAPLSTAPTQARLAEKVASCTFTMSSLASMQRGLMNLFLTLGNGT
jgi:MSHA biogenesis protein MshO